MPLLCVLRVWSNYEYVTIIIGHNGGCHHRMVVTLNQKDRGLNLLRDVQKSDIERQTRVDGDINVG
jgi:hypothetical protein